MTTPTMKLLVATRTAALATTLTLGLTGCKLAADVEPDTAEPASAVERAETVAPVEPELHTVGGERPPAPAARPDATAEAPVSADDVRAEPGDATPATPPQAPAPTLGDDLVTLCGMLEEAGGELDTELALAFLEGPRARETLSLLKRFGETEPQARCELIEASGRAAGLGDDWRCQAACPAPSAALPGLDALDEVPSTVGLSPRLTAGIRWFAPSTSHRRFVEQAVDADPQVPPLLVIRVGRDALAIHRLDTDPVDPIALSEGRLGAGVTPAAVAQHVAAALTPTDPDAAPVGAALLAVDASVPADAVLVALESLPATMRVDALADPAARAPGQSDAVDVRLVTVQEPAAAAPAAGQQPATRWQLATDGTVTVVTPTTPSTRLELQVDAAVPWTHVIRTLDLARALHLPDGSAQFTGIATTAMPAAETTP